MTTSPMKMILLVLQDEDKEDVLQALLRNNFRVTQVATTGGFWQRGSTTLMIGVSAEDLEHALLVIRSSCQTPGNGRRGRATLFVLNVAHFEQI
ncbi:MAG: cyclic-di-AMP receptor [Anaerolineales bacterium]